MFCYEDYDAGEVCQGLHGSAVWSVCEKGPAARRVILGSKKATKYLAKYETKEP